MSRSQLFKVVAVAALLPMTITAACGGTTKDASSSTPGTSSSQAGNSSQPGGSSGPAVVLGSSLSLTGPLGQFGVGLQKGYEQQISEVNAAGGVNVGGIKHPVTLTVLDNRSDPNTATAQVRELVLKDNAVALLGACTPPIVIPEALAAEQRKVPIVSSCNPVRAFQAGNTVGWKYAWDLFLDEKDQAANATRALTMTTSNKKVALFTDTEPDGVAERPLYKAAFIAAGLQVVGDYIFPAGTTDFSSFLNDAKAKGAQLVASQMIPPDGIALWKQMKALSFSPVAAWGTKAPDSAGWPQALGPIAEGTLTEGFWSPSNGNPGSAQLMTTLGKQFPDSFVDLNIAVLGYTVAKIVTDGLTAAGSTDPTKINDAIGQTNATYPLGPIKFNAQHTAATPDLLTQWQSGKLVQIYPPVSGVKLEPMKGLS